MFGVTTEPAVISTPVAVPVCGMHGTQVSEARLPFVGELFLLCLLGWREPRKVMQPALGEGPHDGLVLAVPVGPEPHRLADMMIPWWVEVRPPPVGEAALAQP